ncbi:MAG: alpha/beta fold hydrolase [Chloroflexi bacterium]|nr:alpha/beta fold hydrolase [Chloroflexota bacterium]
MSVGEEFAVVNGARLWTARHGSGPPLVLLHGGPGMWDYFDELTPLIDGVVEVHRYDQRGSGRSQRVEPYDVSTFVADLEALRVRWGHERWIVAGHSWGASLMLAYAVEHPGRVSALIQISGTGVVDDWRDEYHANADARRSQEQRGRLAELRARLKAGGAWEPELDREYCALTWMADFVERERALPLAKRLLRSYGPNYDVNDRVGADLKRLHGDAAYRARVARIDQPVLVIHGEGDPRPVRLAERLAASLPNAHLAVIPNAGHLPWIEQPSSTRDALRRFLAAVTAGTTSVAT